MRPASVEDIIVRAREARLASVTGAELRAVRASPPAPRARRPRAAKAPQLVVAPSPRPPSRRERIEEEARRAWAMYLEGLPVPVIAQRLSTNDRRVYRLLRRGGR